MSERKSKMSRRGFLQGTAAATAAFSIVPSHVLGGPDKEAPSDTFGAALIGCGGRGPGTVGGLGKGIRMLGACDVDRHRAERYAGRVKGQKVQVTQDFRRILERKDIDVVAIATPPHWHALISIAAMQAGKDVLCEKPATRFFAEGRALIQAEKRYNRIYQVGTFGRYSSSRSKNCQLVHKIMLSGCAKGKHYVDIKKGGLKVRQWSGIANAQPQPVPDYLDWNMYCGPAPLRPFHPHRHGGTHRGYWDYEGGGMADMGQHYYDPNQWTFAKDYTSPVKIEAYAPPAHPECCGMWGWVELTYDDGFMFVMESTEWGKPYDRQKRRWPKIEDFSEQEQKKINAIPDPKPMVGFPEAIRTRQKAGGSAEPSHHAAAIMHLANAAIRTGRTIHFDPVKEQVIGDEEANRLINQSMRAPWHL